MTSVSIPILKAGKDAHLDVDTDAIPQDMYALALIEGLKVILNSRMSKVGAVTKLDGEELTKAHAKAMEIANENLTKLMSGDIKSKGKATKSDIPREVMTEARRIAREMVKNEIRKAGMKPSHVAASEITKVADEFIASDPNILVQAKENLAKRAHLSAASETEEQAKATLAKFGVSESPKLVAKAAKAAADKKAKAPLSAKQAGKVAPRKRPEAHATAH